jgi:hypothetical protein
MTATTFPRSQHWTVNGFRVTVLVYKSHRRETCAICGQSGAIHAVWTDRRGDGFDAGPMDFCDEHRPAKGTLPPLDYKRYHRNDDSGTQTVERLFPSPDWACDTCGEPGLFWERLICEDCNDPHQHVVTTTRVMSFSDYAERTERNIRHEQHTLAEWHACDGCRRRADGEAP